MDSTADEISGRVCGALFAGDDDGKDPRLGGTKRAKTKSRRRRQSKAAMKRAAGFAVSYAGGVIAEAGQEKVVELLSKVPGVSEVIKVAKGCGEVIGSVTSSIGKAIGRKMCRGLTDDPSKRSETSRAFNDLLCQGTNNSPGCAVCK